MVPTAVRKEKEGLAGSWIIDHQYSGTGIPGRMPEAHVCTVLFQTGGGGRGGGGKVLNRLLEAIGEIFKTAGSALQVRNI